MKDMKQVLTFMCLSLITASCATSRVVVTSADELDIAEAVFRYQFVKNESRVQEAQFYFISIDGHVPPDRFVYRFSGHVPPVASTAFMRFEGQRMRAVDSETGEPAAWFIVEKIKIVRPDHAVAEGGYWTDSLEATGNTYHLRKVSGKWVAKERIENWISQYTTEPSRALHALCARR